jgi:sterol desaturase/sphingolipid hydroxylase (fatty acid hydroxylase superfamily)
MIEFLSSLDFNYGLHLFAIHEIIWFLLNLPYVLLEKYSLFQQYKIQKDVKNNSREMEAMFAMQMIKEHFLFLLPLLILLGNLSYSRSLLDLEWNHFSFTIARLLSYLWQLILIRAIQELSFYWGHRMLHSNPTLYRCVHRVHHENVAPFALSSEHAHPLESVFFFTGPLVFAVLVTASRFPPLHVSVVAASVFIAVLRSVEGKLYSKSVDCSCLSANFFLSFVWFAVFSFGFGFGFWIWTGFGFSFSFSFGFGFGFEFSLSFS